MKKKQQKLTLLKQKKLKTRSFVLVLILLCASPLIVLVSQQKQNISSKAWNTNSSAVSTCPSTGTVIIKVSYTNTDPTLGTLQVTAQDIQTGSSTDIGIVQPGETKTGQIATGKTVLNQNSVLFKLHRINENTDTASAPYNAISCTPSISAPQDLTPTVDYLP